MTLSCRKLAYVRYLCSFAKVLATLLSSSQATGVSLTTTTTVDNNTSDSVRVREWLTLNKPILLPLRKGPP